MDNGLVRPSTLTKVITDIVKVVDMGILRSATLPQVTTKVVDVGRV